MSPRVRWSMLLSHHPPCDYDRTWKVGALPICVRCLGVVIGTALGLACWNELSKLPLWFVLAMAIPGVADFTLHELHYSASNGARRFLTGVSFGVFASAFCMAVTNGYWVRVGLCLIWFFFLQLIVTIVLRCAGQIENIIEKYEKGLFVQHEEG